jgi:ribosomal protein S18 acetylase RimI-like enzyme
MVLEQVESLKGQSYILPASGNNRNIQYSAYDKGGLDIVQTLWEKLNQYQGSLSSYFPEYFAGREFAARKSRWIQSAAGGELRVDVASDTETNSPIGYCVSTASAANEGHIESIYLEPSYRRLKIGDNLMRRALLWMAGRQANRRSLTVAVGNEIVLPFYERFNFFPRRYILEQKPGYKPT